jgi:hypothetical protein
LDGELTPMAGRILEAQELIHYLQRHHSSQVTLHESTIEGRRAQSVPILPADTDLQPNSPAQMAKVAPAMETSCGPANQLGVPNHPTRESVEAPKSQPSEWAYSTQPGPTPCKRFRMKM